MIFKKLKKKKIPVKILIADEERTNSKNLNRYESRCRLPMCTKSSFRKHLSGMIKNTEIVLDIHSFPITSEPQEPKQPLTNENIEREIYMIYQGAKSQYLGEWLISQITKQNKSKKEISLLRGEYNDVIEEVSEYNKPAILIEILEDMNNSRYEEWSNKIVKALEVAFHTNKKISK